MFAGRDDGVMRPRPGPRLPGASVVILSQRLRWHLGNVLICLAVLPVAGPVGFAAVYYGLPAYRRLTQKPCGPCEAKKASVVADLAIADAITKAATQTGTGVRYP
jgi:hypothetical protein